MKRLCEKKGSGLTSIRDCVDATIQRLKEYIRGSVNKFPEFFRMGTFIDSAHMKLFEVITSGCNALVVPFQQLLEGPMKILLSERVNYLRHREQDLDYREGEELSWCTSWSNSVWQGWSCGLVHCPAGNASDLIWRLLAFSDGNSSWISLKHQHSNPNPNPLANQMWCIDFFTPPTPLIIPHRLSAFLESLMPLKNRCSFYARWSKSSLKHSIRFCSIFSKFKTEFYCISFIVTSRLHFEIHQLWQSGFWRVYFNCCCSCSFEPEIIKIGQSSQKMYSNNKPNFQESTTILNVCTKTIWMHHIKSKRLIIKAITGKQS